MCQKHTENLSHSSMVLPWITYHKQTPNYQTILNTSCWQMQRKLDEHLIEVHNSCGPLNLLLFWQPARMQQEINTIKHKWTELLNKGIHYSDSWYLEMWSIDSRQLVLYGPPVSVRCKVVFLANASNELRVSIVGEEVLLCWDFMEYRSLEQQRSE